MSSNKRGFVKESQVELSVLEGLRDQGNFWFIEVLTHLKTSVGSGVAWDFHQSYHFCVNICLACFLHGKEDQTSI